MDFGEDWNTTEVPNATLAAAGAFSLNWSAMEMGLDFLAGVIWHQYGGKTLEDENPKALARKITFLRKACKRLDSIRSASQVIESLMTRIDELTETRHRLIHGAVLGVPQDDTLRLVRLIHDKRGFHTGEEVTLTREELDHGAAFAQAIAHRLLTLAFVLEAEGPNFRKNARGEVSV